MFISQGSRQYTKFSQLTSSMTFLATFQHEFSQWLPATVTVSTRHHTGIFLIFV